MISTTHGTHVGEANPMRGSAGESTSARAAVAQLGSLRETQLAILVGVIRNQA